MNQQINLYRKRSSAATEGVSAPTLAVSVAALVVLLAGLTGVKRAQLDNLREELASAQTREAAIVGRIDVLGQQLSPGDTDGLAALLEQAGQTLADSERVLAFLEGGAIGRPEGFSRHLAALARRELDGLWLTRITVTAPDSRVALTGRAVRPDLVPAYLKALAGERAFDGMRFNQFLMERPTPQTGGAFAFSIRSETDERMAQLGDGGQP